MENGEVKAISAKLDQAFPLLICLLEHGDINLTVTDDDLASSTTTITISVAEPPPEGFLEELSETLGVSQTMSIVILGLVGLVIMLASFLLITRRSPPELMETPSNKAWDATPLPSYAPAEAPAYEQPMVQSPVQPEPLVEQPAVNLYHLSQRRVYQRDGRWNNGHTTGTTPCSKSSACNLFVSTDTFNDYDTDTEHKSLRILLDDLDL